MDISQYQEGDIIEPEEWRNPQEQPFSFTSLIMSQMKRCLESGSKEMKEGYWDDMLDKFGNAKRTYHEDTRKTFIEAVRSLLALMEREYDDDATKNISVLKNKIEERKKFWLNEEWTWWTKLKIQQQQQLSKQGKSVIKGFFNAKLDFDNYFFDEQLQIYREILSEVGKLIKRKDDYGEIGWEG